MPSVALAKEGPGPPIVSNSAKVIILFACLETETYTSIMIMNSGPVELRQKRQPPEVHYDMVVDYIDNALPTRQARRDIWHLIRTDPKWRKAYEEMLEVMVDMRTID